MEKKKLERLSMKRWPIFPSKHAVENGPRTGNIEGKMGITKKTRWGLEIEYVSNGGRLIEITTIWKLLFNHP